MCNKGAKDDLTWLTRGLHQRRHSDNSEKERERDRERKRERSEILADRQKTIQREKSSLPPIFPIDLVSLSLLSLSIPLYYYNHYYYQISLCLCLFLRNCPRSERESWSEKSWTSTLSTTFRRRRPRLRPCLRGSRWCSICCRFTSSG